MFGFLGDFGFDFTDWWFYRLFGGCKLRLGCAVFALMGVHGYALSRKF